MTISEIRGSNILTSFLESEQTPSRNFDSHSLVSSVPVEDDQFHWGHASSSWLDIEETGNLAERLSLEDQIDVFGGERACSRSSISGASSVYSDDMLTPSSEPSTPDSSLQSPLFGSFSNCNPFAMGPNDVEAAEGPQGMDSENSRSTRPRFILLASREEIANLLGLNQDQAMELSGPKYQGKPTPQAIRPTNLYGSAQNHGRTLNFSANSAVECPDIATLAKMYPSMTGRQLTHLATDPEGYAKLQSSETCITPVTNLEPEKPSQSRPMFRRTRSDPPRTLEDVLPNLTTGELDFLRKRPDAAKLLPRSLKKRSYPAAPGFSGSNFISSKATAEQQGAVNFPICSPEEQSNSNEAKVIETALLSGSQLHSLPGATKTMDSSPARFNQPPIAGERKSSKRFSQGKISHAAPSATPVDIRDNRQVEMGQQHSPPIVSLNQVAAKQCSLSSASGGISNRRTNSLESPRTVELVDIRSVGPQLARSLSTTPGTRTLPIQPPESKSDEKERLRQLPERSKSTHLPTPPKQFSLRPGTSPAFDTHQQGNPVYHAISDLSPRYPPHLGQHSLRKAPKNPPKRHQLEQFSSVPYAPQSDLLLSVTRRQLADGLEYECVDGCVLTRSSFVSL